MYRKTAENALQNKLERLYIQFDPRRILPLLMTFFKGLAPAANSPSAWLSSSPPRGGVLGPIGLTMLLGECEFVPLPLSKLTEEMTDIFRGQREGWCDVDGVLSLPLPLMLLTGIGESPAVDRREANELNVVKRGANPVLPCPASALVRPVSCSSTGVEVSREC